MQEQTATQTQLAQKQSKGKKLLITTGVIAILGTAGFIYWRKHRQEPTENMEASEADFSSPTMPAPKHKSQSSATSEVVSNGFPIKRGSKGDKVTEIQKVLAEKGLLDAKDVIGQYGPKTEAALKKGGYPTTINEALFISITGASKAPSLPAPPPLPLDAAKFAQGFYAAAVGKNFSAAISLLKLMKSTADYSAVSEKFKTYLLNGVRQTLVNGLLSTFTSIDQKAQLKQAFLNVGLKYDGSKFSLSGIANRGIITSGETTVYDENLSGIRVPANMVLGTHAGTRGYYTQFKNKGKHFLVHTAKIKHL